MQEEAVALFTFSLIPTERSMPLAEAGMAGASDITLIQSAARFRQGTIVSAFHKYLTILRIAINVTLRFLHIKQKRKQNKQKYKALHFAVKDNNFFFIK